MALTIRPTAEEEAEIEKLKNVLDLKTTTKVFTHLVLTYQTMLDELKATKNALLVKEGQFDQLLSLTRARIEAEKNIYTYMKFQGGER